MMKPILFNTEMVRAILEGRKTVTRRIQKDGRLPFDVGDVLWVRETWDFLTCITCMERDCTLKPEVYEDSEAITEGCWLYRADSLNTLIMNCHNWRPSIHMPKQAARIFLRVTEVAQAGLWESIFHGRYPAIAELHHEGIERPYVCTTCYADETREPMCVKQPFACGVFKLQLDKFAKLWDSTVPKGRLEREGWEALPKVWVIRFERVGKPEGWPEK